MSAIIHFTESLTESVIESNNIRQEILLMSKNLLVDDTPTQCQQIIVIGFITTSTLVSINDFPLNGLYTILKKTTIFKFYHIHTLIP